MARTKNKREITKDDYPDIKRRYQEYESLTSIAQSYGRDHSTIIYHIKKMGLPRHKKEEIAMCYIRSCIKKEYKNGFCKKHYNNSHAYEPLRPKHHAEDLNNLIPLREWIDPKENASTPEMPCDHTRSSCDCLNPGKYYKDYIKK